MDFVRNPAIFHPGSATVAPLPSYIWQAPPIKKVVLKFALRAETKKGGTWAGAC